MDDHNDFAGMVRGAEFSRDQPIFYFFNLGETHYPYMLADMPKISGVHGVFKQQARDARREDEKQSSKVESAR
jgi:hypothetical protein